MATYQNIIMSQDNTLLISSLNLHSPKKWKIVARVKYLSAIMEGSTGRYFFVDLIDSSGEIRAIAYNPEADRLYNILEENSVYSIENGKIQKENKKYTDGNNYEVIFNEHSIIIKQKSNDNMLKLEKEDSSVALQSQCNALPEDCSQNRILKEARALEICKKLRGIKEKELELAMEKLKLEYELNCIGN